MSNPELRRLEQQFALLAAKRLCKTCAQRVTRCPECNSPIGSTPREVREAEANVKATIENIASRIHHHRECYETHPGYSPDDLSLMYIEDDTHGR